MMPNPKGYIFPDKFHVTALYIGGTKEGITNITAYNSFKEF
jgi:hypothetical protein